MRFTKKAIDELEKGIGWSDEIRGLGVRVSGGTKTFILKYRMDGQQRWMSFGRYGEISIPQALKLAAEARNKISLGVDPSQPRMVGDTMSDLIDRFIKECIPALKPKSRRRYLSALSFFKEHVGSLKIKHIRDAHAMHMQCTCIEKWAGGTVNTNMGVLSRLMDQAERWGLRRKGSNPCQSIQKVAATKRERFLTLDEINRLECRLQDPTLNLYGSAVILMLLYTGARYDEIRTATWDRVDLERGTLLVPIEVNKRPKEKIVTLNKRAVELLKTVKQDRSPFVFPSLRKHTYTDSVNYVWKKVRADLGFEDVHLHDLRHTYATILLSMGANLDAIAPMLGQDSTKSTQIYAHLYDESRKALAEKVDSYLTPKTTRSD